MRSRISGRDSDDSVDTGRKLVCEAESGAWGLGLTKINRWKQIWSGTDTEDKKNPNGKSSRSFYENSH